MGIKKAKIAQISSASGSFNRGSGFADVTNLSVTIKTSGKPVLLALIGDGSNACSVGTDNDEYVCNLRYVRGVTTVVTFRLQGVDDPGHNYDYHIPGCSYTHIDRPPAGTYTYKVTASGTATTAVNVFNCKLVAYEVG